MIVYFSDYVLDTTRRQLCRRDGTIALTPKAFALVEKLVESHPAAVSKEELYDALWPGVFVEMGNLYTLVAEVRAATGDDAIIRTVHRFGYALGHEVGVGDLVAGRLITEIGTVALRPGENVIGRDLIPHPEISRRHARIIVSGGTVMIEDLGSRNGTWVDGRRIEAPTSLKHGQTVLLAGTKAVLTITHRTTTAELITT